MLVMVLDSRGRINAAGPDTAGFVVPEGGSLVDAPDTIHDTLALLDGPNVDLYWEGGNVVRRERPQPPANDLDARIRAMSEDQKHELLRALLGVLGK